MYFENIQFPVHFSLFLTVSLNWFNKNPVITSHPILPSKGYLLFSMIVWKRRRNHTAFLLSPATSRSLIYHCHFNTHGRDCHIITAFSLKPQGHHLMPTRTQTYHIIHFPPLCFWLPFLVSAAALGYSDVMDPQHETIDFPSYFQTSYTSESLQLGPLLWYRFPFRCFASLILASF